MTKAEYQNEEYKADIDLIGMMTKSEEEWIDEQEEGEEQEEEEND